MLSNENHDWRRPLTEGPSRLGFDTSYVAMQGIQRSPFIFFRDEYLDVPNLNNVTEDIKFWVNGEYKMEQGISMIQGGGGQGKCARFPSTLLLLNSINLVYCTVLKI